MIIIDHVDTTLKHSACQPGLMINTILSFFIFTTLYHSSTLVEIGEVVEKLLALDYHHQKTTNQLKYSA